MPDAKFILAPNALVLDYLPELSVLVCVERMKVATYERFDPMSFFPLDIIEKQNVNI